MLRELLFTLMALMLLPLVADADIVLVDNSFFDASGEFISSRSSPGGIDATDGWTSDFILEWTIVNDDNSASGFWEYEYRITDGGGYTPTTPDVSHWILEVSTFITADNVDTYIFESSVAFEDPKLYGKDLTPDPYDPGGNKGNPNLPVDLYGIKFEVETGDSYTWSFQSLQAPMWGNFYVKDGAPGSDVVATAWNTGITDTTGPTESTTDFTPWIPVPDTFSGGGGPPIPEPSSLLLLAVGASSIAGYRRLRRRS